MVKIATVEVAISASKTYQKVIYSLLMVILELFFFNFLVSIGSFWLIGMVGKVSYKLQARKF